MRRTTLGLLAAAVFLSAPAVALDGAIIVADAVEGEYHHVPITAPYGGPDVDGRIEAVHMETGEAAPVTVRDGMITLVPATLSGEGPHRFRVSVAPGGQAPRVRLELDEAAGQAAVYVRDEHFTTYNFGEDFRMPVLWPVHAEGGVTITRNFPMGEDSPVESTDHRHHMSMWTTHGSVNGLDFWHHERKVTRSIEIASGDAYGTIRADNDWVASDGQRVLSESREYRFYDSPASGRLFDLTVTLKATDGDVEFGDTRETGLFAFRIRPELQGNQKGVLTNASGAQTQANTWGLASEWIDYSGPVEGFGNRGIAVFEHPGNFRHPARWHVRDYGLVACNPFGASEFPGASEPGSYLLPEGGEITFRFRCFVHSGDVNEADVAGRYAAYANPPAAKALGLPVRAEQDGDRLVVYVDGKEFTAYKTGRNLKYPFFYPVNGPRTGQTVTVWNTEPYPHHSSLYISSDHVSGARYWQPFEELETGQIVSTQAGIAEPDGHQAVLTDVAVWGVPGEAPQLRDRRTVTIWAPSADLRLMDFQFEFEVLQDIEQHSTGHSLFSARMHPDLAVDGGGTIVDAYGNVNEAGTREGDAPWCAYFGEHHGEVEGLAIIQHSGNAMYPGRWFNRDYGFFSPTPFWLIDEPVKFSAGGTYTLRYRVAVFAGDHEQANIAAIHDDFERK